MKHLNKMGFVGIETVIAAALVLSVGFIAIIGLSTSGRNLINGANQKIEDLDIFGDNPTVLYDEDGYPQHLNITPTNITPEANFVFVWDSENSG
jgi:hypothetical protein